MLIDLRESLEIALREFHLLPQPLGRVRSLDRLHAQVEPAIVLLDRRVLRVGERAGGAVAHAGEVVLVATERLRARLRLVRAEALVDHSPDDVVVLHAVQERGRETNETVGWEEKRTKRRRGGHMTDLIE